MRFRGLTRVFLFVLIVTSAALSIWSPASALDADLSASGYDYDSAGFVYDSEVQLSLTAGATLETAPSVLASQRMAESPHRTGIRSAASLVAPGSAGVYRLPVSGGAARHVVFDRVEAAVLRHGGEAVENGYMFPTRRAARQAASEISGDLGSATEAIRASDFRGGPRWMENSDQVIGRSSADGLTGWRDDFLGHTFRDGMQLGPHVNVWASGIDSSLPHLFYPGAMG